MSRKTLAAKAVVAAGAVAATVLVAGTANATNTTTHALTGASPATTATSSGGNITLTGRGFTSSSTAAFTGGGCTGGGTLVPFGSSSTRIVVTPPTGCADGAKPSIVVTTGSANSSALTNRVTFITPADVSQAAYTDASGPVGFPVTITGLTSLPTTGLTATLGGRPLANFQRVSATSIKGRVPAGLAAGPHDLVVLKNGVPSAARAGFTVLSSIRVTPSVFVKGATVPVLKIEGLGFKPTGSSVRVTVCGVPAVLTTPTYTDKVIHATAPTFSAASAAPGAAHYGAVDATHGGVCVVQVRVDVDDDTTYDSTTLEADADDSDDIVSVINATSTFTYAAY